MPEPGVQLYGSTALEGRDFHEWEQESSCQQQAVWWAAKRTADSKQLQPEIIGVRWKSSRNEDLPKEGTLTEGE